MKTNLFARAAHTFSGSPWLMWLVVVTYTLLALDFLLLPHPFWLRWLVIAGCAFIIVLYSGAILYFYQHREQLAKGPAPPVFNWKIAAWIGAIVVVLTAVFVGLELTVWRA